MKHPVRDFCKEKASFLLDAYLNRGLYLCFEMQELFIYELRGGKTIVFEYECKDCLTDFRTEVNTMEKYILQIPKADFALYDSQL